MPNKSVPSAGSVAHKEKRSRAPIAAGDYHTSGGEPIAKVSHSEDRRVPSNPKHGPIPNIKKTSTQGFADAKRARGHAYPESKVVDAHDNPGVHREQTRKQVGGNVRSEKTVSSFGGKKYSA
jgi:hypothetical protein